MRVVDIIASSVGLVLLSPLLIVIALVVKFTSPGPVFYQAERVARHGRLFRLYKFRSMVADAGRHGPATTVAGDSRVTRVGRLLRHYKLDELPQLINVLKGEMSLVGPRPVDPRYVTYYSDEQRLVLSVRPGITSPASLAYRNEETMLGGDDWEEKYVTQILPDKLAIELEYMRRRTLWTDVVIILRTIIALRK